MTLEEILDAIQVDIDDNKYVRIKDVCKLFGINYVSQVPRLKKHPFFSHHILLDKESGFFIRRRYVPLWLRDIPIGHVKAKYRPQIIAIRDAVKEEVEELRRGKYGIQNVPKISRIK